MVIRLYLGMLENAIPARGPRGKIRETVDVVDRTIDGIRRIIGKWIVVRLHGNDRRNVFPR